MARDGDNPFSSWFDSNPVFFGDVMRKLKAFKCEDCQHEFERLVDNGEIPECPACHSNNTRFCYSSLAIKVNGQGAYTNRMKI